MKKHISSVVVAVLLLSVLAGNLHAGTYSGGTGEPNSPYIISKAADWQKLMTATGDWNKYFLLTADIDLIGVSLTPIGNRQINFTGVFDGSGHVLSNATINLPSTSYVGLFGYVYRPGQIKNLGVEDVHMTGEDQVGGLCGSNGDWDRNGGAISNCYATGSVTGLGYFAGGLVGFNYHGSVTSSYATDSVSGAYYVGGLVGISEGSVGDCHATGIVTGTGSVGGLVGENYNGSISSSYATGPVTGTRNYVGGLMGYNCYGGVASSYATGSVTGGGYCVGGFVGQSDLGSSVTSCSAAGTVTGSNNYVGGFMGQNDGHVTFSFATGPVIETGVYGYVGGFAGDNDGTVISSYATGSVSGSYYVGGLIGWNDGSVTTSYAIGSVTGSGSYVGGLIGGNDRNVSASFWNTDTSGCSTSDGGTDKATGEMKTQSTFSDAGWDFATVWAICDGTNYPRLRWQIPAGDLVCPEGIDFKDYAVLSEAWMSGPSSANWNPACDISDTKDDVVDWSDLAVFAEGWMATE